MGKTQSVRYNVAFDDFSRLIIFLVQTSIAAHQAHQIS